MTTITVHTDSAQKFLITQSFELDRVRVINDYARPPLTCIIE